MAERTRSLPEEWARRPWRYASYVWHHFKALDRQRAFSARMDRIESAELMHIAATAVNAMSLFSQHRQTVLATAAGRPAVSDVDLLEDGLALAFEIKRAKLVQVC